VGERERTRERGRVFERQRQRERERERERVCVLCPYVLGEREWVSEGKRTRERMRV